MDQKNQKIQKTVSQQIPQRDPQQAQQEDAQQIQKENPQQARQEDAQQAQVQIHQLVSLVEARAQSAGLKSVKKALPLIQKLMSGEGLSAAAEKRCQADLLHALEICEMLIDLHPGIAETEEDILLTAVLMHIYPENVVVQNLEEKLMIEFGLDPAVCEILLLITPERGMSGEEEQIYYERIQENKLALLAILADRGNIVQQLYRYSSWDAHRYIDETKVCYFPMCIYGKEHYHDLLGTISVLMEKLRSLIEVAEILLRRYEVREAELIQDILALREENATIKGIIAKFRESEDA